MNANKPLSLEIRNATVVDPVTGIVDHEPFAVRDGEVVPAGDSSLPFADGTGMLLVPGLLDVHVHFRDPGNTRAETLKTGAAAAAHGGFTRVVTMPNTTPACDSPEALRVQSEAKLPVRILPSACVTRGRAGRELADLPALAAAGASAFSDDGAMVADDDLMFRAGQMAAKLNRPIMDHAVVPALAGKGVVRDCPVARSLGLPIFPPEAEIEAVRRDIEVARKTGCAMHIQHLSCAESIELIRSARAEGLHVTGEATPHHLALAAEEIPGDDGNWRMNPPLGTKADRAALRAAVIDGTVTILATDHAPHAPDTKDKGFLRAPFGIIGDETAFAVTYQVLVKEEKMDLLEFIRRWTTNPAKLINLDFPSLRTKGAKADFTLIDLKGDFPVEPSSFQSLSRNCPFSGRHYHSKVRLTVCDGVPTWTDLALA